VDPCSRLMVLLAGTDVKGFTLLEVLVALSIFAMLGLGSHQLLRTVIDSRDATENRMQLLTRLQRAFIMLERDLVQITNRPIRNQYGDTVAAIELSTGDYILELSRLGWRNPAAATRSSVQRVAYLISEDNLERHYWEVLDRAEDSEPRVQVLLEDVADFRVNAVSTKGESTDYWDSSRIGQENPDSLADGNDESEVSASTFPPALELIITLKDMGEIRRIVNLVEIAETLTESNSGNQNQDDQSNQEDDRLPGSDTDEVDEGARQYEDE